MSIKEIADIYKVPNVLLKPAFSWKIEIPAELYINLTGQEPPKDLIEGKDYEIIKDKPCKQINIGALPQGAGT